MVEPHPLFASNISGEQLVGYNLDPTLLLRFDNIVSVNPLGLSLFGASSPAEIHGKSFFDLISPICHEQFADHSRRRASEPSQSAPIALTICRLDGSPLRIQCLISSVSCADGHPASLIVMRTGAVEQQSIADRHGCEIPLRTILETAMDGIISIDEQQEIVLFNSMAESIFGWRAEQVLGQPIDVLLPERFREHHYRFVQQFGSDTIERRRMGEQRQVLALRASGEEFPIEASISKSDVHGKRFYTVILRDVSDSVRDRQQIEQQAQMLDQVSDSVSVLDADGKIVYWNQGAVRLFGWKVHEAIGRNARHLLYRGDAQTFLKMQRETNSQGSWAGELPKVDQSGRPLTVEHRRTVLRDPSGALTGYICIDFDITERKKRERAAQRSQRLESIGTLAGGIAHDLNNILTPILMGAKLLTSGRQIRNSGALLETIEASARRGAELVKQVLEFAGGTRKEQSTVDINKIVYETQGLLDHTLPKSIQIQTHLADQCPQILGDATELSQILMNLCINARDAMPNGGQLTIETGPAQFTETELPINLHPRPGYYACLKVTDTGSGMSPEVLDRIFDPFFTTKEVGKGTGLGLATVQGIVRSYGGFINVYSEPGMGTTFTVFLPAVSSTSTSLAEDPHDPTATLDGMTVMVVDDEVFILQMTSAALLDNGFEVITARDGKEAIALFSEQHPSIDVVLLDMMMPGIDGLQILDELRQINSEVIVVACSGLRTTQREEEVRSRGAKAFLPKPYTEEQLLQTLSTVLKQPASTANLDP